MAYALPGFLGYLGVQSIATTFPFALTLGATHRSFAGGTLLWSVVSSAYLTAALALLTMLELATNHWFAGFHVFDIYILGAGDLRLLLPIVFLGSLTLPTRGGVFGAAWIRFGTRGPQAIGLVIAVIVIVGLIIVRPSAPAILAAFKLWWLTIAAVIIIALSSLGTWRLLRPAIVR